MTSHRTLAVLILCDLAFAATTFAQWPTERHVAADPRDVAPRGTNARYPDARPDIGRNPRALRNSIVSASSTQPSLADRFGAPPSADLPRSMHGGPYRTAARPWQPPNPVYHGPHQPPTWSPPAAGPNADHFREPSRQQDWTPPDLGCVPGSCGPTHDGCDCEPWTWQFLPRGILFRSFLAGPKETRLGVSWNYRDTDEWVMDGTIGGKIGLFRYGTRGSRDAEGYQVDFESAALLRMNWTQDLDMDGTDFRFGVPLTYSKGRWEWRFGYYHLSAHAGDELLVRRNTLVRENYIRDSLVFGLAYFVTPDLRIYGQIDGAFHERAGADAWHFQVGFDYSPVVFGPRGAPFLAVNGLLREEVNYGGGINVMAGWQWQPYERDHLLRLGLRYYNGESTQYTFFDEHEELIGFGLWYDY